MENSMEIPRKVKNRTTVWSINSILGYFSKEGAQMANKHMKKIISYQGNANQNDNEMSFLVH